MMNLKDIANTTKRKCWLCRNNLDFQEFLKSNNESNLDLIDYWNNININICCCNCVRILFKLKKGCKYKIEIVKYNSLKEYALTIYLFHNRSLLISKKKLDLLYKLGILIEKSKSHIDKIDKCIHCQHKNGLICNLIETCIQEIEKCPKKCYHKWYFISFNYPMKNHGEAECHKCNIIERYGKDKTLNYKKEE